MDDDSVLLEMKSRELKELSKTLAFQYITSSKARLNFINEINEFIEKINFDVNVYCMSQRWAIESIQSEIDELLNQRFQLISERVQQYAYIEAKKNEGFLTLALKQIGFIGGGMQIFSGGAICYASLGLACASIGIPMLNQGINNAYENGYYLLFREDTSGYVRNGYRHIAKELGYSDKDADMAYAVVDLGLSGYGVIKKTAVSGRFKLFRNINGDFIYGWQEMGRFGLLTEMAVDASTIYMIKKAGEETNELQ